MTLLATGQEYMRRFGTGRNARKIEYVWNSVKTETIYNAAKKKLEIMCI